MMQKNQPINLFDKDTMFSTLTPGYLKNDGTEVYNSGWYISDYIPVNGTSFVLKNVGGVAPSIVLYDANKQFLSGKNYNTKSAADKTNVYISSASTAYYCRFSGNAPNGSISRLMEYLDPVILQYN